MADLELSVLTREGKPVVSSLQLAEHFGIKHNHILRDIKALLNKVPAEWGQSNFGHTQIIHEQNRQVYPAYTLTRDAFTLLAMGYNSTRAIAWKIKYIEAFNALEQAVLQNTRQAALAEGARLGVALTPARRAQLRKAAGYQRKGLSQREIGLLLNLHKRTVWGLLKEAKTLGLGV